MSTLLILAGALQGASFDLLGEQITVGRGEDNHICIDEHTMSRHHAVLARDGVGYKLRDLQSTNGTRVNGQTITESMLRHGNRVAFGDLELRYDAPAAPVAPPLARPAIKVTIHQPAVAAPAPPLVRPNAERKTTMQCKNHQDTAAVDRCAGCAESFCGNCLVEIHGQKYCGSCKVLAVKGQPVIEEATIPCKEASEALKYAIIGIFCFGIVLEPVAISKALKAKKMIALNPRLTGSGKCTAALIIGIAALIMWVLGVVSRVSQFK